MNDDENYTGDGLDKSSSDEHSSAPTANERMIHSDAKEQERQCLQEQVEAFLASGGTIDEIPSNVVSDPPKKPESNYGGQPI